jgi:hypothetical protein
MVGISPISCAYVRTALSTSSRLNAEPISRTSA